MTDTAAGPPTPRRARWAAPAALAVIVVAAAIVSQFASAAPDGLAAVAAKLGFAADGRTSPATASPLAGYTITGVADPGLSSAVAGLLGVAAALTITYFLLRKLARRRTPASGDGD